MSESARAIATGEVEEPFGFNPGSIDVLLLTHGHLDHCGRIPLLVKRGFRGEIVATSVTRELTRLVLLDSAHLQEKETARRARHAEKKKKFAEPLKNTHVEMPAFNTEFDL